MTIIKHLKWLSLSLIATTAHALNPMDGPYAGIIFGVGYKPNLNVTATNPITAAAIPVTLGFKTALQGGGQLGYRICENYRLEAEILYNNTQFNFLRINNVTIYTPSSSTGLRMNGAINAGLGFINGYYDLFLEDSNVVPYAGVGVGYGYIQNVVKFYYNNIQIQDSRVTSSTSQPAGQAIVGVGYFMDDFTYFALDIRGMSTLKRTTITRTNNAYNTNLQVVSANLVFNGMFDLD